MEIRKFIDYLKGEKKTSANTCDAYFRDLNAFRIFLTERGVTDMSEASSADVAAYLKKKKNFRQFRFHQQIIQTHILQQHQ